MKAKQKSYKRVIPLDDKFCLKQDDNRESVFWVFDGDQPFLASNNRHMFFFTSKQDNVDTGIIHRHLKELAHV